MKRILYITGLASIALASVSCVHLLPIALDTATDNDPYYAINNKINTDYIDKFTATDIITDQIPPSWGLEKDACKDFELVTDVKYAGEASLLLQWDKSKKGCDWLGSGLAWNNWQVVDMSNVVDTWALSFWVRTKTGTLPSVPLNFNFIDKSDKSSEVLAVGQKFYKGQGIDENWKQIIIPLAYFRFRAKGMNLGEISQLIVSYEGTASIYIDEMKFINTAPAANQQTASKSNSSKFEQSVLFADDAKSAWGINKDKCRDFSIVTDIKKQGTASLHMQWDRTKKGCNQILAGFAWTNWASANFAPIVDTWALRFWVRIKTGKVTTIPLSLNFVDEGSAKTDDIAITNKYFKGGEIDEKWTEVTIPLSHFRFKENGLNLLEIKQLTFICEGAADLYIDEIQLVNIK